MRRVSHSLLLSPNFHFSVDSLFVPFSWYIQMTENCALHNLNHCTFQIILLDKLAFVCQLVETQKCIGGTFYAFSFSKLFNHQKSLTHEIIVEIDLTSKHYFLDQCVKLDKNIWEEVWMFWNAKIHRDGSPVPRVCKMPQILLCVYFELVRIQSCSWNNLFKDFFEFSLAGLV